MFSENNKEFIRNTLKQYEGKNLADKQFRILQGVLSSNFGHLEQKEKVERKRRDTLKKLKSFDRKSNILNQLKPNMAKQLLLLTKSKSQGGENNASYNNSMGKLKVDVRPSKFTGHGQ